MMMPGRSYAAEIGYRYGFNGKENDNEVKGEGNQQDYGLRIYDTRLSRFLSVDPLKADYPWNSPYAYCEGDPINYTDLEGGQQTTARAVVRLRVGRPQLGTSYVDINGRLRTTPIGPNNPGLVPPGQSAYRDNLRSGWYITTNNGGFFKPDPPPPMTQAQREELRKETENVRLQKAIITNAYSEKETPGPSITIDVEPKRITNDVANLKGGEIIELRKRIEKGTGTEQDKVHAAQLVKARISYQINEKHDPSKPAGGPDASLMPENHSELWDQKTTYYQDSDTWWSFEGTGKKAVFHQFKGDGNGTYHWAGSTGTNKNRKGGEVKPVDINKVPNSTKKKAGYTKG